MCMYLLISVDCIKCRVTLFAKFDKMPYGQYCYDRKFHSCGISIASTLTKIIGFHLMPAIHHHHLFL